MDIKQRPAEARPVNSSSGLCDVCQAVDFRFIRLRWEEEKDDDGNVSKRELRPEEHNLGYLDQIVATTQCTLCRLVTKALEMSWSKIPVYTLSGDRIRCFIPASNFTSYSQTESEKDSKRRNWELKIELDVHDTLAHLDPACKNLYPPTLRLDVEDASAVYHPDGLYNLGRVYTENEANLDLLKDFYYNCKENHPPGCE